MLATLLTVISVLLSILRLVGLYKPLVQILFNRLSCDHKPCFPVVPWREHRYKPILLTCIYITAFMCSIYCMYACVSSMCSNKYFGIGAIICIQLLARGGRSHSVYHVHVSKIHIIVYADRVHVSTTHMYMYSPIQQTCKYSRIPRRSVKEC